MVPCLAEDAARPAPGMPEWWQLPQSGPALGARQHAKLLKSSVWYVRILTGRQQTSNSLLSVPAW